MNKKKKRIKKKEDIDDITQTVIDLIKGIEYENRVVLDISVYPELPNIMEVQRRRDAATIYYIPDTIPLLLNKAKENEQYYFFLSKLFTKWTQRFIDVRLLNKIFVENEYDNLKFELITKEMVDIETYEFCYNKFAEKDLFIELSPEFNLVGDIVGKILGFAKKSNIPILMLNQKLVRYVKKEIPIFDTANMFVDKKQEFFSRFIPLRRTRGIRWFIGITVGTAISPIGFVLAVIDP